MKRYIILILSAIILFGCSDGGSNDKTEPATVTITPPISGPETPDAKPSVEINKSQIALGESIIVQLSAESQYTVYVNFLGAGVSQTETLDNESKSVEIFPTESGNIKITAYSTDIDFSVSFTVAVTVNEVSETPEAVEPPDETGESGIKLALIANGTLYFYDGTFQAQENTSPINCGNRCFTASQSQNIYDASGDISQTTELSNIYDIALDDWQIVKIDPATAYSLGGQSRNYTDIYYQDFQVGHWSTNQWECAGLFKTVSGAYIATDSNGNYHPLSETINGINYAGDILIKDFNAVSRSATIETDTSVPVSWSTNYFNNAKQWIELDGKWYSWNGYVFDGALTEQANALWEWNSTPYPFEVAESPVVLAIGVHGLQYWLECNTGWLFTFNPENDVVTRSKRLYTGDGLRTTGLTKSAELKPILIENWLYFHDGGSIYRLDLDSGIAELFFSGEGVIYEW